MTHFLTVQSLQKEDVHKLMHLSQEMRTLVKENKGCDILKHQIMATLFFEPSTRTNFSFQAAMLRLGGAVMNVCGENTSIVKGETAVDTVRTMCCYCDVLVIRHPEKGMVNRLAQHTTNNIPVINGGDGCGEHPTQALLDLFTIFDNCCENNDNPTPTTPTTEWENPRTGVKSTRLIQILFVGDLRNSRTVHSLVRLLSLFSFVTLLFVSPPRVENACRVGG